MTEGDQALLSTDLIHRVLMSSLSQRERCFPSAPFRVAAIALQVPLTPKLRMLSENISSVHSLTSNGPYLLLIRKENKSLDANKSMGLKINH